ncbi:MAG: hypothetical protein HOU01_20740, partial [Streptomycetaceae bacterium]|nr:hypothetical protein [Streptomycetaceae bacterium]
GTSGLADAATELANLATWAQARAEEAEPRRPHPLEGVTVEQLAAAISNGGAPTPVELDMSQSYLDLIGPAATTTEARP